MDLKDFKNDDAFKTSSQVEGLLDKLDLNDPGLNVVDSRSSIPSLMQSYMACQAQTNEELIRFMGQRISEPLTVDGVQQSVGDQHAALSRIGNKQNLLTRQMERSLFEHLNKQAGLQSESGLDLINDPPASFGIEAKVSDSGLRLITPFSGDSDNNENDLNFFLREVFTLAQTSNLTEAATVSVIIRKIAGSAQILLDDFVVQQGGPTKLNLKQVVGHLERKFIIQSSPLHADAKLHNLTQDGLSYSQLQAKVQKLVKLACRLEKEEKRATLVKVKECSAFLMAISTADRLLLNAENSRRANENISALSLDQMVNFLAKCQADKMNYRESNIFAVQEDGAEIASPFEGPVNYVQRGGFPGRFRSRGSFGRGSFPHQRGQYQQNRGSFPQQRGGVPRPRGTVQNGRFQRNKHNTDNRKFVTCEMANVKQGACILCGEATHLFKDPKCKYYGCDLMQSPCRTCHTGAHPTAICQTKVDRQPWAGQR